MGILMAEVSVERETLNCGPIDEGVAGIFRLGKESAPASTRKPNFRATAAFPESPLTVKIPSTSHGARGGGGAVGPTYTRLVDGVTRLLQAARAAAVRSVDAVLISTYWEIGRRIVEFEQGGKRRAGYGQAVL